MSDFLYFNKKNTSYSTLTNNTTGRLVFSQSRKNPDFWSVVTWMNGGSSQPDFPLENFEPYIDRVSNFMSVNKNSSNYSNLTNNTIGRLVFSQSRKNPIFWNCVTWMNGGSSQPDFPENDFPDNDSIVLSRQDKQLQLVLPPDSVFTNMRYGLNNDLKGIISVMTIFFDQQIPLSGELSSVNSYSVNHDVSNNAIDIYDPSSNIILLEDNVYNLVTSDDLLSNENLPAISRVELGMGQYVTDLSLPKDEVLYTNSNSDRNKYLNYKTYNSELIKVYSNGISETVN